MIEAVYQLLAALGYTHPIHPVATHIPMGMILGGFMFFAASFKWKQFEDTAYYCQVMSLVFIPPTVILGIMDWMHRYSGNLTNYIIAKMILAAVLTIALSLAVYLRRTKRESAIARGAVYGISTAAVIGLGFIGAHLIFS